METDKITSSYRVSLGEDQIVVDVTMNSDGEGDISKILSNCANAYVDEVEMLNGEAHYMGGVVFDLLYVDETGASRILSEKVDLNGRIQNDQINPFMKPVYKIDTVNTKVLSADGGSVKVIATVGIKLDAVQTDEVEEVRVNDDNIQLCREHTQTNMVVASGTKTFEINEVFDTKMDIKNVLCAKAHVDLKDADDGTGYFSVSGNLFVNALLDVQTGDELCMKNFMETIAFKEELEDEQIQKGDNVLAFAFVRPQDLSIMTSKSDDGNEKDCSISVKAVVTVKYVVQRACDAEVYTDAFSMKNKTNIVSGTFMTSKPQKIEKFSATIDGQTVIDENEPRIAKICAVANEHLLVANTRLNEGELTVEGVAYATVIYQTDDDVPQYNSVDLEIPFANKFDVDGEFCGNIFVTGDVTDVDTKVKKGKEINITLDVCFLAYSYDTDNQVIIKDIELAEELPESEYSIEMYIAPKGSTAWDVSKHLLVTEDVLTAQNPELVFPLERSQTVVHFNQRG